MIGRTIFFFWNKTIHSCFARLESHCHSRREIIQFHLQGKCTSYTKISGFVTRTQGRTELYPTNFRHLLYWKSLKMTVNENFSQTVNENFSCMFPGSLRYFLVAIFETVFDSDKIILCKFELCRQLTFLFCTFLLFRSLFDEKLPEFILFTCQQSLNDFAMTVLNFTMLFRCDGLEQSSEKFDIFEIYNFKLEWTRLVWVVIR